MTRSFPELTHVSRDWYHFPLADGTYDLIFSASVIEHVPKIWHWIKELVRVCKRGGRVLIIAPVSWPYHAVPVDCWRIYPEEMKALYEEAGLAVEMNFAETLEDVSSLRGYPGRTHQPASGFTNKLKSAVKRIVKWALPYAVDTVTFGVKPLAVSS